LSALAGFFGAQLLNIVFGAGFAWHPALRRFSIASRIAFAYVAGVLLLTIEGMLFTLAHIQWSPWRLGLPLALLSIVIGWWSAGIPAGDVRKKMQWSRLAAVSLTITVLALAGLCARVISGEAATVDFVWFWGVKAVRFAYVHGIDFEFLRYPLSIHAHPNYPPLVPVNMAWSILVSGSMPWMYAALVGCLWVAAAVPLLFDLLRLRLDDDKAMLVVAVWSSSICAALVASNSAGGGEMQLVAAMSIGAAALLVDPDGSRKTTVIVIVALAAAMLCKLEATFEVLALLAGVFFAARVTKESALRFLRIAVALFAPLGLWWLFSIVYKIPLTDPIRERVLKISFANAGVLPLIMLRNLGAGAWGVPWLLVILFLGRRARQWREFLPAAVLVAATLGFSIIYYLHVTIDPSLMVSWTLPRLMQPALSASLLAAGLITFGGDRSAVDRP
jgi:hypothetical protein